MSASFEEIKKHLTKDKKMEISDEQLLKCLKELADDGLIEEVDKE
jgi:DNA-binding HxlR family transcriptional regulator